MTPEQYVQDKAAKSGSSFYYAFLFLPPPRRAAITAFYAFCREVDDVVDEVSDPSVAATKLAWWRKESASAFAGQPSHPVMKALMPHVAEFDIRLEHLLAVIDGCQMDLDQSRYLDFAGLARYCHQVAGVVGEVASGIFGRSRDATVAYAHQLGLAMQLTNIIRDVGDDARRGRIYLPMSELKQFDVKAQEILNRGYSERFTALLKFQAERAHRHYDQAFALLPEADRRAQKPGLMMANIYRTLLREIEADGFQVLHQRTSLTPLRKLWIAMRTNWAQSVAVAKEVGIVGGGWAGLAAAVEAVQRGHSVTLFDMAPQLGGRARAVERDGLTLDNGQHILIGAYTESLRLLRTIGVDLDAAFLRTPLRITYPDAAGLRLGPGPAIPAFIRAVLQQRSWLFTERLALLAAASGWALRGFHCAPRLTVSALTGALPARVRTELIDPLCVAALNTTSAEASAEVFLRVMKDALFSGAGSADLLLPRWDLSRLFATPCETWLRRAGATLRLTDRVERIEPAAGRWAIVGKRDANEDSATVFDHVVLACTPVESARLTRHLAPAWSRRANSLHHEPIVTVYLHSAGVHLSEPMLALREDADSPAQFVFDRGQLGGPAGLLAFVISGAARWVACGASATEAAVLRQARQVFGAELGGPMTTLTEKRATFRCTPGLTRAPLQIAPGLSAAGDHVDGPYPATLEGAVRSGLAAARSVVG